ncbi:Putative uncharacterized protein [Moritella viscosa]|uniref:hypothetical protein n=1 Tax=Moritella viscosa TaxID=80854 RepID=UPI00091EE93A|nr:hypothetical protein [Moritella viscosa]SGY93172.1 Putative uncharacterized protein [Moritella viscosa]
MHPKQLRFFPKLKKVLSSEYLEEIENLISLKVKKTEVTLLLNIYVSFVDICVRKSDAQYNAFDIRNSDNKLNTHFSALLGFIYAEFETSSMTFYKYCYSFKKVFYEFGSRYNMYLNNIEISDTKLSKRARSCIELYQSMNINTSLLEYYSGWTCEDKAGDSHNLHLATWCDAYGAEFTTQIHAALCDYAKKHKGSTLRSAIYALIALLNELTKHCETKKDLEHSLKAENSTSLMENILNSMLFKSILNNNAPKSFIKTWTTSVKAFSDCFIDTNFFEEPLKPFLMPEFREPSTSAHTISVGGDFSDEEKARWLVDIPLEIKDEEALNMIHQRLNKDLEHIRIVSQKMFEDIKYRLHRNMEYRESGTIKPLPNYMKNNVPMGIDHLDNTVATFYHHGFGVGSRTTTYLGFDGQGDILLRELNLPTSQTLNALASLLILEHPKITPGWLQEWELFNKNKEKVGLKKVGKQWIAVSFKNRKGATTAQQEVVLTDHSKRIVDTLIDHTNFAREALKIKGGSDWRYVMLTADLQKASRTRDIGRLLSYKGKYHQALAVNYYDDNKQIVLSQSDAKELAKIVTLRSIRKAKGLQIYLETESLKAVSEALGHKELRLELLEIYLPKPLMDYFNKRWVRQFQNAIIFEALKDSSYLFDALDFDELTLDEFLKNHRLGDLPEHLERASSSVGNEENQSYINNLDELVFTLSVPLFQVLLAIQNVIDNATQEDVFKPVINTWYQSAMFILSHFSLSLKGEKYRRPPEEVIPLYETALSNPLDLGRFKENVLCR